MIVKLREREAEVVDSSPAPRARLSHFASLAFLGVLPAVVLVMVFVEAIGDDAIAFDFRPFYRAAEAILAGDNPYPGRADTLTAADGPYVYPPFPALLAVPLTALPFDAAGLIVMTALVAAALATLYVLGVRDWRCYGLMVLWPPVISAVQTGNVTLLLGLAAALAWTSRDRSAISGAALGITLATKLFFWPLLVWFAATRRLAAAAYAAALGAALLLGSWVLIGFDGLRAYAGLLRRLEETVGDDSYTAYIVALDLGLPSTVARTAWIVLGLAVLVAVVVAARSGDERTAFILAIAASLALTPIVWLHYFALLAVVVAVAQPTMGVVWFLPLAMVITPGSGHPTPFQTTATLTVAILTIALSLRVSLTTPRVDRRGYSAERLEFSVDAR